MHHYASHGTQHTQFSHRSVPALRPGAARYKLVSEKLGRPHRG